MVLFDYNTGSQVQTLYWKRSTRFRNVNVVGHFTIKFIIIIFFFFAGVGEWFSGSGFHSTPGVVLVIGFNKGITVCLDRALTTGFRRSHHLWNVCVKGKRWECAEKKNKGMKILHTKKKLCAVFFLTDLKLLKKSLLIKLIRRKLRNQIPNISSKSVSNLYIFPRSEDGMSKTKIIFVFRKPNQRSIFRNCLIFFSLFGANYETKVNKKCPRLQVQGVESRIQKWYFY